jgi:hypothetical protein
MWIIPAPESSGSVSVGDLLLVVENDSNPGTSILAELLHLLLEAFTILSWEALEGFSKRSDLSDKHKHVLGEVLHEFVEHALSGVLSAHGEEIKGGLLEVAVRKVLENGGESLELLDVSAEVNDLGEDSKRVGENIDSRYNVLDGVLIKTFLHVLRKGGLIERRVVSVIVTLDTVNSPSYISGRVLDDWGGGGHSNDASK